MAYPFYPAGYQQFGSYLPANYQPVTQPQFQNQTQSPQQSQSIIWVSGMQEAQMYPVAPNNAVALWEQSGKTIYLKSADATGKPTMRVYDLVERTETAVTAFSAQDDKNVIYAKKDDLEAVLGVIKGISGDIEQIKGDLYGMAGRKKAAKKAEVTDDDE